MQQAENFPTVGAFGRAASLVLAHNTPGVLTADAITLIAIMANDSAADELVKFEDESVEEKLSVESPAEDTPETY